MKLHLLTVLLLLSLLCQPACAQRTKLLQHLWEVQPNLGDIWREQPVAGVIQFDVENLKSKHLQERVRVAQLICREYNNSNFKNRDRAITLLVESLNEGDAPIQLQRSLVSALILLSDGEHADFLWKLPTQDALLRNTIENAMLRWKKPNALDTWRARVDDPSARPVDIALAIKGLGELGTGSDGNLLQQVLTDNRTTPANRLLAADAIGKLNTEGLIPLAKRVLDSDVAEKYLIAAYLLKQQQGEGVLQQLKEIFTNGNNAAQSMAARSLAKNFPDAAKELAPAMAKHADTAIRQVAIEVFNRSDDAESIRQQATLLSDKNIEVRRTAGKNLINKAMNGQRDLVDECVSEHLNGEPLTGIEQAIIVAVHLQDQSRCGRLVELLKHPNDQVHMTAGWALMEIAEDTEIIEQLHRFAEELTKHIATNAFTSPLSTQEMIRLSYIFELFGRKRYAPAESMLMKYVPKDGYKMGVTTRASAIWALGQINDGKDNPELRRLLQERLADTPPPPEDYLVRYTCALALGEMAFADCRANLREFREPPPAPLGYACDWALAEIAKAHPENP